MALAPTLPPQVLSQLLCMRGTRSRAQARTGATSRMARLQAWAALWNLWVLLSGVSGSEWLVSQS